MHAVFFYPLVGLAAAAAIAASLNYALVPPEPAAQTAQAAKTGYRFTAEQLSHIDPGADQYIHPIRDLAGPIDSIQLATRHAARTPSPAARGARLMLTPQTAQALNGKPLKVTVWVRPLAYNTTPELSLSAQGAGPVEWIAQPLPIAEARVTFTLPATSDLRAIGFWPHPQDDAYYDYYGVEILDLRVESAG